MEKKIRFGARIYEKRDKAQATVVFCRGFSTETRRRDREYHLGGPSARSTGTTREGSPPSVLGARNAR